MSSIQYKNLALNSIVFTIANLGSKIISFIMVPLYTYALTTEEYGTVDLMTTFNSLLLPILFLCVSDAILRYCMDKRYNSREVLSNAIYIYILGTIIILLIIPIIGKIYPNIKTYGLYLGILFLTNGVMQACNQYLRASNHLKVFALNGILYTFVFASLNIIFLVWLKLGVNGYLLSMIFANVCCTLLAIISSKIWNELSLRLYPKTLKVMLKYSIPLIPNALMWWIMDASDKFIISYYLGIGANGIYAVAKKLPTLIDTFHSIFNQAWQISAIQENNSSNVKEFTSTIYKIYFYFLVLVIGGLLILARPFTEIILNDLYRSAWTYIPFLLLAVGSSCLSSFLSANLIAAEQTGEIFKTTIIGAVINTILNFMLIPSLGLNGAAIATFIGFLVVMLIRESLLRNQNKLDVTFSRLYVIIIISTQIVIYYIFPLNVAVIALTLLELLLLLSFWNTISILFKTILHKIHK